MNIVMITSNDPAGMAVTFTNAINRYTEHTCRLITSQDRYGIDFGKDIHLPDIHDDDYGEIEDILKKADIFHFHMLSDENAHLGPLVIRDYVKGKKIVHHHHGHPDYILNIDHYNDKYKSLRRRVIVSTPDLVKIATDATWLPNMVPINDVDYLPRYDDSLCSDVVKVCQAPTRKFDKHTSVFRKSVETLIEDGASIEPVVIERVSHRKCLQIKKKCHIVFDHMRGWFGISSLESLSQGKTVIAGLDEWNIQNIKEFTGTESHPWQLAYCEETLKKKIIELVQDKTMRLEMGKSSRVFMEKHWTEQDSLRELFKVYNTL